MYGYGYGTLRMYIANTSCSRVYLVTSFPKFSFFFVFHSHSFSLSVSIKGNTKEQRKRIESYLKTVYENLKAQIFFPSKQNKKIWVLEIDLNFFFVCACMSLFSWFYEQASNSLCVVFSFFFHSFFLFCFLLWEINKNKSIKWWNCSIQRWKKNTKINEGK